MLLAIVTLSGPVVARSQDAGSATITLTDPPAYVSSFVGISSVGSTTVSCPAGKMMVGVAGSRAKFIVNITPLCATLNKDGAFGGVGPLDAAAVGVGGGAFLLQCSSGTVMMQLRVAFHTNTALYPYLGGVEAGCSTWMLSMWNTPAPSQIVATTGFDSWPVKGIVTCTRQSQPVRSIRIRRTTALKGLSIICDE